MTIPLRHNPAATPIEPDDTCFSGFPFFVPYFAAALSYIQANTDSVATIMVDDVSVTIHDVAMTILGVTMMIHDVMSVAVLGIHPYAYL